MKAYYSAVGRRKSATARVRYYKKDTGPVEINGKPFETYFPVPGIQKIALAALTRTGVEKPTTKITIKLSGGGTQAQAESVRLAIARILVEIDPEVKPTLRQAGYLTRDPRVKERKKPGLKRARRAPQWAKR